MGITYDIEKDAFFKKGQKQGEEKGEARGIEIGQKQGIEIGNKAARRVIVINLLRSGKLSIEEISDVVELSLQEIKKIAQELDT